MPFDLSTTSILRLAGEELTLRQIGTGSFDIATQTLTPGATVDTLLYGTVHYVSSGIDGITVKRGDLEVWMPKPPFDSLGKVPVVGNLLLRGTQQLVILTVETWAIQGFYRMDARIAE